MGGHWTDNGRTLDRHWTDNERTLDGKYGRARAPRPTRVRTRVTVLNTRSRSGPPVVINRAPAYPPPATPSLHCASGRFPDGALFEAMTSLGLLSLPGISCCDAWQNWALWPPENAQVRWMKCHGLCWRQGA